MSEALSRRYVVGVVKGLVDGDTWLKPHMLDGVANKAIMKVLDSLLLENSTFDSGVVRERLIPVIGIEPAELLMEEAENTNDLTKAGLREIKKELVEKYVRNHAASELSELAQKISEPEALDKAMYKLRELRALQPSKIANLGSQVSSALKQSLAGNQGVVPTGIEIFDRRVGGISRKEITIVAARPGHGKTSLTVQLALNWIRNQQKVMFISLEMPTERLIQKLLSNMADIDGRRLRLGRLTSDERTRLIETAEKMVRSYKHSLLIYDDVRTLGEMDTLLTKHSPDVMIVDFIQLMSFGSGNQRNEIAIAMQQFKHLAKENNAAIVIVSQLNRAIETREDPRPRMSDLAESGALEQLAADILFIYYGNRVDPDNEPPNQVEIFHSKARYGEPCRFRLGFDGSRMRYMNFAAVRGGDDEEQQDD